MAKNHNSVVVLQIRVKFWWMIPMGVKYNHTKFEQETQRWRPGTGFASGGPRFQKLQFRAKNSHFWAKKALEPIQNGQTKGNGGYTPRAAWLPRVNEPFAALSLHDMSRKRPKKPAEAPNADNHKPRIGHIFGYMAQNAIPRAPSPPATPPLFVLSTPQNCPNGRLDPNT